jgi:hypothetical protein
MGRRIAIRLAELRPRAMTSPSRTMTAPNG